MYRQGPAGVAMDGALLRTKNKIMFALLQKKRTSHVPATLSQPDFRLGGYGQPEPYRSTTAYPHQSSSSALDDLSYPYQPSSMAYMFPMELQVGGGRPCEVHMPPGFQGPPPIPPTNRSGVCGCMRAGCNTIEHICTYILCCGVRGLLSKFPSRAKRIDVISRFVFPLIFAISNLAYWLYYLFAKSKSPQLETWLFSTSLNLNHPFRKKKQFPHRSSQEHCLYMDFGFRCHLSKFPSRAKQIDIISRFVFPLIFNWAYWTYWICFPKARILYWKHDYLQCH